MNGYERFEKIKECYNSMTDDLSKQIFMARLQYDMEPSFDNVNKFLSIADRFYKQRLDILSKLVDDNKKIYFYGIGFCGLSIYNLFKFMYPQYNIEGFFDKKYDKIKNMYDALQLVSKEALTLGVFINNSNILNKQTISPPPNEQWVKDNKNENYVICITSQDYVSEIKNLLINVGVDDKNIITLFNPEDRSFLWKNQYFEFKEYFKPNGAFIDAGCFDGQTSVMFTNWCDNHYSKIYAFEPDSQNIKRCENNKQFIELKNLEFINAGVGSKEGIVRFCDDNNSGSHISENGNSYINIKTIDNIVKNEYISFIKIDVEGAELDALKGAAKTIQRDKPLCAICIYHKPGDVIVIAEYLKELVPEYKFKIRHYSMCTTENILYAYIE